MTPLPSGPFATLVVDPPWQVKAGRQIGRYIRPVNGKQPFGVVQNAARDVAYPTLSVEEIAALPVGTIAARDAHLYLWVINKYLPDAFAIASAWGFQFSTLLTWAKRPMGGGLGGAYGISSEHLLFCRRGTLRAKQRIGRTWFDWKRPYKNGYPHHSAKPPEAFEVIESVSGGPYVELFARTRRPGWTSWGDQLDG